MGHSEAFDKENELQVRFLSLLCATSFRTSSLVLNLIHALPSFREGLQMTAKGWGEEPPLSYMRGSGTLSTKGRTSEDDLKYLKVRTMRRKLFTHITCLCQDLVAEKGNIPRRAYEEAIQSKLDRDP